MFTDIISSIYIFRKEGLLAAQWLELWQTSIVYSSEEFIFHSQFKAPSFGLEDTNHLDTILTRLSIKMPYPKLAKPLAWEIR